MTGGAVVPVVVTGVVPAIVGALVPGTGGSVITTGGGVDGGPGGEDPPSGGKVPVANAVPSMVCAIDDGIKSSLRGEGVRFSSVKTAQEVIEA